MIFNHLSNWQALEVMIMSSVSRKFNRRDRRTVVLYDSSIYKIAVASEETWSIENLVKKIIGCVGKWS